MFQKVSLSAPHRLGRASHAMELSEGCMRVEEVVRSPATKRRNQFRIYASRGRTTPSQGAAASSCGSVPGSRTETPSSQGESESVSESEATCQVRRFRGLRELGRHLGETFQASPAKEYKDKEWKQIRVEANVLAGLHCAAMALGYDKLADRRRKPGQRKPAFSAFLESLADGSLFQKLQAKHIVTDNEETAAGYRAGKDSQDSDSSSEEDQSSADVETDTGVMIRRRTPSPPAQRYRGIASHRQGELFSRREFFRRRRYCDDLFDAFRNITHTSFPSLN